MQVHVFIVVPPAFRVHRTKRADPLPHVGELPQAVADFYDALARALQPGGEKGGEKGALAKLVADPMARMVGAKLNASLGQQFIVDNRPGASGSMGAAIAAKATPDGYTWLFVFDTHAVDPSLIPLPFDTVKDLALVMLVGTARAAARIVELACGRGAGYAAGGTGGSFQHYEGDFLTQSVYDAWPGIEGVQVPARRPVL